MKPGARNGATNGAKKKPNLKEENKLLKARVAEYVLFHMTKNHHTTETKMVILSLRFSFFDLTFL